jgi:23S rRNA (adenine2030-N6)-methyltransferase
MNYRHSRHAGNAADVFKHAVLALLLERLRTKERAFCVLDSHAGAGLYALEPPGEFEQGIGRLWPARAEFPALAAYFAAVEACNPDGRLRRYPGSPLLIRHALRAPDRAVLFELEPGEHAALRALLAGAPRLAVHRADGWERLAAFVPPPERRGLVLLDPPYEQAREFQRAAEALAQLQRRWRDGLYVLWYPIKVRAAVARLHRALRAPAWAVELLTLPEDVEQRLNGSGLILLNPPPGLIEQLREILLPLARRLAGVGGRPAVRVIALNQAG